MSDDEYVPLVDRERKAKSRVHQELTQTARERLVIITDDIDDRKKNSSIDFLMSKVGSTPVGKSVHHSNEDTGLEMTKVHRRFLKNGETKHVLTYLEDLIKSYHLGEISAHNHSLSITSPKRLNKSTETAPLEKTAEIIDTIEEILVTEGLLWDIQMAGTGGVIQFVKIESESMKKIDDEIKALAEKEPWQDALKGYNAAFERYLNGDFDDTLVTKLYNSIEQVLHTICVDMEGWTDEHERGHGFYLELLDEHGVYNANGITAPEINQLLGSLEKLVNKVGHDRKQRHAYHDRTYCTLLIHQVGAYIYFLISRYDSYKM